MGNEIKDPSMIRTTTDSMAQGAFLAVVRAMHVRKELQAHVARRKLLSDPHMTKVKLVEPYAGKNPTEEARLKAEELVMSGFDVAHVAELRKIAEQAEKGQGAEKGRAEGLLNLFAQRSGFHTGRGHEARDRAQF